MSFSDLEKLNLVIRGLNGDRLAQKFSNQFEMDCRIMSEKISDLDRLDKPNASKWRSFVNMDNFYLELVGLLEEFCKANQTGSLVQVVYDRLKLGCKRN